jgi:hypothetical protein
MTEYFRDGFFIDLKNADSANQLVISAKTLVDSLGDPQLDLDDITWFPDEKDNIFFGIWNFSDIKWVVPCFTPSKIIPVSICMPKASCELEISSQKFTSNVWSSYFDLDNIPSFNPRIWTFSGIVTLNDKVIDFEIYSPFEGLNTVQTSILANMGLLMTSFSTRSITGLSYPISDELEEALDINLVQLQPVDNFQAAGWFLDGLTCAKEINQIA